MGVKGGGEGEGKMGWARKGAEKMSGVRNYEEVHMMKYQI